MLDPQFDAYGITICIHAFDRKLRDERRFMLHLNLQIVCFQKRTCFTQDGQQLSRCQAMVRIILKPCLQPAA